MQPMNGAKLDFPCEQLFLRVAHELHLRAARLMSMAEKLQLLKLLQEIRGFAEVGNRADELRQLAHFSVNLRAAGQPTSLPVRRFLIPVRHEQHPSGPTEIPIKAVSGLTSSTGKILKIS